MKNITTGSGDKYVYDEKTHQIFKNDKLLDASEAEPVFSGNNEQDEPMFSGIYIKKIESILTPSGRINKLVDPDTIG